MPRRRPSLVTLLPTVLLCACSESFTPAPAAAAATTSSVPAAPGSLGAHLAAGSRGDVVLSWLEPQAGGGHALRYARYGNGAFDAPATVASGRDWFVNWADFPSVVPIRDDYWAAHWLVRRAAGGYAYDVYAAVSADAGRTWSAPVRPHRDDTDSEHGFVSIFPHGRDAGLLWLDGRYTSAHGERAAPAGMTLRSARLAADASLAAEAEVDGLVCDCCQTDVVVTARGPVALYRDRSPDEVRDIYAARHVDGRWLPAQPVADDGWTINGCPVNGPAAASRGDDVVVAWFTGADDRPRVQFARSGDAGAQFAEPVLVAGDAALGRTGVVALDDGTAIVSWLQAAGNGVARLLLTPVGADDAVGRPYVVADGVAGFSVPQLALVDDALLVVWTTGSGDASRLAATAIPLARIL